MNAALVQLLREPEKAGDLGPQQWDELIPQARNARLLATLGMLLEDRDLLGRIPPDVRRHFVSATLAYRKQQQNLRYELKWIGRALADIGERLVLLKGAAYSAAGLAPARGRLMSDIDLLVPAARIGDVEAVLNRYGWESGARAPYDERYYRKWMHEIPPLGHVVRASTLDVHHTVIPPTANVRLDVDKLFANLREIGSGTFVLGREDMVIHSAAHLFHEGEFGNGLRDLWDLHRLMDEFAAGDAGFWDALVSRARELDLVDPLFYGLRYARLCFGTAVPEGAMAKCAALRRSPAPVRVMDFLFRRAFVPDHPSCLPPGTGIARECLYVRSHYLRMPLYLLLPHLARKAWMGIAPKPEQADEPVDASDRA